MIEKLITWIKANLATTLDAARDLLGNHSLRGNLENRPSADETKRRLLNEWRLACDQYSLQQMDRGR